MFWKIIFLYWEPSVDGSYFLSTNYLIKIKQILFCLFDFRNIWWLRQWVFCNGNVIHVVYWSKDGRSIGHWSRKWNPTSWRRYGFCKKGPRSTYRRRFEPPPIMHPGECSKFEPTSQQGNTPKLGNPFHWRRTCRTSSEDDR